jgi:hypothetical protein
MDEIVSWVIAALIGIGALVGFTGVVATSVLTVVRRVTHTPVPPAAQQSSRPFTSVG